MSNRTPRQSRKTGNSGGESIAPETPEYMQMLRVLRQFRVVIANIREHYRDIELQTGMSGAQLWALNAIAQRPSISVGQLARELGVHQSTASNLLTRLTELRQIERKRNDADLRVVTNHLTAQGKRSVKNAPQPAIGMLQQALLSLPGEQLTSLHANLDELIKTIGLKRALGAATPLSTSFGERRSRK